jgi:hypothetical protein
LQLPKYGGGRKILLSAFNYAETIQAGKGDQSRNHPHILVTLVDLLVVPD